MSVASFRRLPLTAGALLFLVGAAGAADARGPSNRPGSGPFRVDEFAGWYHDAGNVLLHVSNMGLFGRAGG
ncbi:MAG TPA: hypothetical protein VKU85_15110, partial [bacterium]|nr:hypothetical protein [bacterium]